MSITTNPSFAPSITPFSPKTTSLTCGEFGNIVIIASTCCATSFGVAADFAPNATISSTAD